METKLNKLFRTDRFSVHKLSQGERIDEECASPTLPD